MGQSVLRSIIVLDKIGTNIFAIKDFFITFAYVF